MFKSIKWIFFLMLALLPLSLVQAQSEPSTLRIGATYILDTLNPTAGFYGYSRRPLWHDTLIEYGGGDTFAPAMADEWTLSDDGLVWDFHIREGMAFSDGTAVTAEEVAWSLNFMVDNEIATFAGGVQTIEAVDGNIVRMTMSSPIANMITAQLIFTWILPRSYWENIPADEIGNVDGVEVTLGSGPYRVTEFAEGQYLILEAVAGHWRGDAPVDRIIYQEYASEDALVQAMLAGEIDVIEAAVPFSGVSTVAAAENITVSMTNGFGFEELIINSSPEGTQPASLNDSVVRQAIEVAVDKEQISTIAYLGYTELASSFLVPAMGDFFNQDIPVMEYNLDEANRILDDAGYVDTDGDGIREYSDGTSLFYRLYAPASSAYYARVIDIISGDLGSIGIGTDVQILADEALIDLQPEFDYDLVYWGWAWDPDPDFALSVFTCAEAEDYGWSDSGYCNEEYDELYALQATQVDSAERIATINLMQAIIYRDKPYIPVVYPLEIGAYRNDRVTLPENFSSMPAKWWLYNGFAFNN